jgi:hypothetical protein
MSFLQCLMAKLRETIANRSFLKALTQIPSAFGRELMKDAFGFEREIQNHMDNLRRALVESAAVKEIGREIRETGGR